MARKRALLIGNGKYESLPPLEKYKADVTYLARALRDPDIGAFDDVKELIDKTYEEININIQNFFINGDDKKEEDKIKKDDLLLLYLSGHGKLAVLRNSVKWYFTGINTDENNLRKTGISAYYILGLMNDTDSRRVIIIIDACHASGFLEGAKGGSNVNVAEKVLDQFGHGNAILMAASNTAWENNKDLFLSNFTHHLVQGLITGWADRNNDGNIDVDEWFAYTAEQVGKEPSKQTPEKRVDIAGGPLLVAKNPNWKAGYFPTLVLSRENIDESTSQIFIVGGKKINLIILARGDYSHAKVWCFYEDVEHLPADLKALKDEYERDNEVQKTKGVLKLPYNSPMYKLREFDLGHRVIINDEEVPNLYLKFGPTDYFSQIVTDLNIDNPLRKKYFANAGPIVEYPVPEFSTILGVNLNIITADNYLIITERSRQAKVAGGKLHTSVGENLLRPKDSDDLHAPDPFLAASRGAKEELGISLDKNDIVFNTFTVIPDYCQYSLIATVHISQNRSQIEEIWQNVIPADKWESRRLLFYSHDLDTIARFVVSTWERWFHVALASVVLSLLDRGYSWEDVDKAFLAARSNLSL